MLKWLRHLAAERREIATARRALAEQRKRLGESYYSASAGMNYLWAHPKCKYCVHCDRVVHLPITIPRIHYQYLYCNARWEYVRQRDPNPALECIAYYPKRTSTSK